MSSSDGISLEDFSGPKILLTGLSQSGKTSIIQVVFEKKPPDSTKDLQPTVRFTRQEVRLNGYSYFTVDVGGQIPYLEEVLDVLNETVFNNLSYLFYVVDASDSESFYKSRDYFALALKSVEEFSKDARIVVLAHKMDLIEPEKRANIIKNIAKIFFLDSLKNVEIYGTSIYEDSIITVMNMVLVE